MFLLGLISWAVGVALRFLCLCKTPAKGIKAGIGPGLEFELFR